MIAKTTRSQCQESATESPVPLKSRPERWPRCTRDLGEVNCSRSSQNLVPDQQGMFIAVAKSRARALA
eukprot:16344594-Heterocapsa_arctica.AAC.1